MNLVRSYFRELFTGTWSGWNRFWFSPADPATVGLIRVLAGGMLFYTHLVWTIDLLGFFGPEGRLPVTFVQQYHNTEFAWSHLYYLTTPAALWAAHIAALVVLFLFMIGCCTRVTSILAFLITVSYAHRAAGALFGLDQINGFLALYLALGPAGAAYSVDAWWRRRRGQGGRHEIPNLVTANVSQRLIQVHMCVVYFFAGVGKLLGQTWWSGTALWGALANLEYQTLDVTWLASYPLIVNFMTHVILAWEVSYCVLIWPRLTRPIMLALAVPLHLGIALGMGMITFGVIMLIGNLSFVSPVIVRMVLDRRSKNAVAQGETEQGGDLKHKGKALSPPKSTQRPRTPSA